MRFPVRLLGLACLAALYWVVVGTALILLTVYGVGALGFHGYCSGPGNQLGRPSCEGVARIVMIAGFFLALALYSRILWKLARRQ